MRLNHNPRYMLREKISIKLMERSHSYKQSIGFSAHVENPIDSDWTETFCDALINKTLRMIGWTSRCNLYG